MEKEILGFNRNTGSLTVRFFTADYPEGLVYNVDVPIVDGAYISGPALDELIDSFSPYGQIEYILNARKAQVPDALQPFAEKTDAELAAALLPPTATTTDQPAPADQTTANTVTQP